MNSNDLIRQRDLLPEAVYYIIFVILRGIKEAT